MASRHKRKRQDVESNLSIENQCEISRYSLEIITLGGDLDDGVVNTTQNVIWEWLQRDKLVHNGNKFDLNVKQLYRKTEGQEKYQIRKPHRFHVHNLKALMRLNPYAHVVDYVVLLEMEDIPIINAFDESRCFDCNYYVESFYRGQKRIDVRVCHKPHF